MNLTIEFKEFINGLVQYGLPILAFIGSIYSVITSRKANRIKDRVLELEKELKEIQLEKEHKEIEESTKACVEARIYKLSQGKYRLKLWNSGKATAHKVNFHYPEEHDGMFYKDKVPYAFLEPGKSFEEIALISFQTPSSLLVTTTWLDDNGKEHSKQNMVSV